ncbi:MAG: carboxymuconolactone decarboxylase family protein [Chloroflexi bacterium]|nr:carboxymuconolactone decarboxylase family protein [Chloroflexota bacterium]
MEPASEPGAVSPALERCAQEMLAGGLRPRADLVPRDRSLVTVSARVTAGQVAQITVHLNRARDNGLTKTEASEVLAHLAYYAGWPFAFSSVPVFKAVFDSRAS